MTARILLIGDIHLGRRPGRLPPDLEAQGLEPAELGPAAAWAEACSHAIRENVDAVALAGDVVESVEDRFEASIHLERGFRGLEEAGIPVVAVAGNHDVQALPRLADLVRGFKLLGRGGVWETCEIGTRDGGRLRFLGRSFAGLREPDNPLSTLDDEDVPADGVPCLGLLHCDDAGRGFYAPIVRGDLARGPAARVDAWFLGHIHRPDALRGPRPVGYLGSLVGLDPGEPGRHGPWLAGVGGPGRVDVEQLALAPLRWEPLPVDVSGIEAGGGNDDVADAVFARVRRAFGELHARLASELGGTRAIGCRVHLRGRTPHHAAVRRVARGWRSPDEGTPPQQEIDGVLYFVEKAVDEARPDLDLEDLARSHDPVGLLARQLLALGSGGADARALLDRAGGALAQAAESGPWSVLSGEEGQELPNPRELLLEVGHEALERLLERREAAAGEAPA